MKSCKTDCIVDPEYLLERFLSYTRIDTRSEHNIRKIPSTPGQWVLIRQLEKELNELGLPDVKVSEYGYVTATIKKNSHKDNIPRIAFLAHVDTSPDCPGKANPIVHWNYQGQKIILPEDSRQVISVENQPLLKDKIGEDIVTAAGNSLLGADDKAGIAVIMAVVNHILKNPEIPHGDIRICFNPDEEVANGTEKLEIEELNADFAYTLDAEHPGEIDYETFSADEAILTVKGVSWHPGWAKGHMVNALRIAADFVNSLPMALSPENTEKREGFIHPIEVKGNAAEAVVQMIVRDFELDGLTEKRGLLEKLTAEIQAKEERSELKLTFAKQYRNMRYWLEKDFRPVEYALEAVRRSGISPVSDAIRGGTDGSRLTERGLPTPNIFTGAHNFHSFIEWVSLQDMMKSAETLIHLLQIYEEKE